MSTAFYVNADGSTNLYEDGTDFNHAPGDPGILNVNNTAFATGGLTFYGSVVPVPPGTLSGTNPTRVSSPYVQPPFYTINAAVGSKISFIAYTDVYPGYGNPNYWTTITEVDLSVSGGKAILSDPSRTKYSVIVGKHADVTSDAITSFPNPPTASTYADFPQLTYELNHLTGFTAVTCSYFIDNTVGAQTWTFTVKYASGNYTAFIFSINVEKPSVTFSPVFPAAYNFGPFVRNRWVNGRVQVVFQVTSPWTAPAFLNSNNQAGFPLTWDEYKFGACAQSNIDQDTANAERFSAVATNTTHSPGVFYLLQVAYVSGPYEYSYYNWPLFDQYGGSNSLGVDPNGFPVWSIDGTGPNSASFPIPYAYQADRGNVTAVQPAASTNQVSIPGQCTDANGNIHSYIPDNPSLGIDPNAPSDLRSQFLFHLAHNETFQTSIVFHQTDNSGSPIGIPVAIATTQWVIGYTGTNVDTKNNWRTLHDNLGSAWLTTYTIPGNWLPAPATASILFSPVSYATILPKWLGTIEIATGNLNIIKKLTFLEPTAPLQGALNLGPMGAVAQINGRTGRGLYNGLSPNVSVMNVVM